MSSNEPHRGSSSDTSHSPRVDRNRRRIRPRSRGRRPRTRGARQALRVGAATTRRRSSARVDSSSSQRPRQKEINVDELRLFVAGFLLLVRPRFGAFADIPYGSSLSSHIRMRFAIPRKIEPPSRIGEVSVRISEAKARSTVRKLVKYCLEGIPEMVGPTEWGPVKTKKYAALSGKELLTGLLMQFDTPTLIPLVDRVCVFAGKQVLSTLKSCGRVALVSSLVELFQSGTLPQLRRKEENLVLRNADFESLHPELCGIPLPKELLLLILSYLNFDYDLIRTVGCVNMPFYALVLSNWSSEVVVRNSNMFSIPSLVLNVAPSIRFASMNSAEIDSAVPLIPRERVTKLVLDCGVDSLRLFFRALSRRFRREGQFGKLRRIYFQSPPSSRRYWSGGYTTANVVGYRLARLAPRLEVVNWPKSLWWCDGLRKLRGLAMWILQARPPSLDYPRRRSQRRAHIRTAMQMRRRVFANLRSLKLFIKGADERSHLIERLVPEDLESLEFIFGSLDPHAESVLVGFCVNERFRKVSSLRVFASLGASVRNPGSLFAEFPSLSLSCLRKAEFAFRSRRACVRLDVQLRLLVPHLETLEDVEISIDEDQFATLGTAKRDQIASILLVRIELLRRLRIHSVRQTLTFASRGRTVDLKCRITSNKSSVPLESSWSNVQELLSDVVKHETRRINTLFLRVEVPKEISDEVRPELELSMASGVSHFETIAGSVGVEIENSRYWKFYRWVVSRDGDLGAGTKDEPSELLSDERTIG